MTTLGTQVALNLPDCAPAPVNSSQLSGGMALGQIPGSSLSVRGRPFCIARSAQSDTSLTRSAISSLAVPAARLAFALHSPQEVTQWKQLDC